ncbi:hypothetical protein AAH979_37490 [Plantactinospora sp. ZYX-F-223]|uniref:hypothetical protein n=1 Tax=Plantactinospora sp. ZYX-F-223 TaxID=3144103 RepID=UPI0031FCE938
MIRAIVTGLLILDSDLPGAVAEDGESGKTAAVDARGVGEVAATEPVGFLPQVLDQVNLAGVPRVVGDDGLDAATLGLVCRRASRRSSRAAR